VWTLEIYQDDKGRSPYQQWEDSLDNYTLARILARIERIKLGHFGDVKSVGDGVGELRFNFGSGYRIYFGLKGRAIIILLCAGDKSSQLKDIQKAKKYWIDYEKRTNA
jgi:putative addiction module killer protein